MPSNNDPDQGYERSMGEKERMREEKGRVVVVEERKTYWPSP